LSSSWLMKDPTGVTTVSVDPALNAANQNLQVSLDCMARDVITTANQSGETNPPWHLDRINQGTMPLYDYYQAMYTGGVVHLHARHGHAKRPQRNSTADDSRSKVVACGYSFDGTNNTKDCEGYGIATRKPCRRLTNWQHPQCHCPRHQSMRMRRDRRSLT